MSGYDVFEVLNDGDVLWHAAPSEFAEAKKIAEEKAARTKHSFFILDQATQTKLVVDAGGVQAMREAEDRARKL